MMFSHGDVRRGKFSTKRLSRGIQEIGVLSPSAQFFHGKRGK